MPLQKSSGAAEFAKTTATSINFTCITQEAQHVDTNTKLGCVLPTLERYKWQILIKNKKLWPGRRETESYIPW